MVIRVITIYINTTERIKRIPIPILSLETALILNNPDIQDLFSFSTPEFLKTDIKLIITPLILFYSDNIVSGSNVYERRPVSHSDWPLLLSDHTESVPSVLIMFFFYSLSSASD